MHFLFFMILTFFSSSLLYYKNTVYNPYNIKNMYWLTVYVISKASSQQWAISRGFWKVQSYVDFWLLGGLVPLALVFFKGQLNFYYYSLKAWSCTNVFLKNLTQQKLLGGSLGDENNQFSEN